MVSRVKRDMLKDVMTVIGGGLLEIVVEAVSDAALGTAPIINGPQPYNVGDAMGGLESLIVTTVGIAKSKNRVIQLGAGGLAVAVPNLVMKAVADTMPAPTASLSFFGGSSQGSYGKSKPMGATPVTAMRYPR